MVCLYMCYKSVKQNFFQVFFSEVVWGSVMVLGGGSENDDSSVLFCFCF